MKRSRQTAEEMHLDDFHDGVLLRLLRFLTPLPDLYNVARVSKVPPNRAAQRSEAATALTGGYLNWNHAQRVESVSIPHHTPPREPTTLST
jgi:hypothetical protein